MNTFNETGKPSKATTRRAALAEATGKAVREAARAEFEEVGFEQANIRSIAKRAGVSPGTVIHHHGDKRELLHAALFEGLDDALRKALAGAGDGPIEEQLDHVTASVFRFYGRRPGLSRTLLREALFAEGAWAKRFAAQAADVHAALVVRIESAKHAGELRPDADAALFALAYLSFFYFGLISWVQGGLPKPAATVGRLVRQQLDGLRAVRPVRRKS